MPSIQPSSPSPIWILPTRGTAAQDLAVAEGWVVPLLKVLAVASLPPALVFGIPEVVRRQHQEDELIFAQFFRQPNAGGDLLVWSVPCGRDQVNREAYLTLLQRVTQGDEPLFDADPSGLPEEEVATARQLAHRFKLGNDQWVKSVLRMLEAVRHSPHFRSFANVPIPDALHRCDWEAGRRRWRSPIWLFLTFVTLMVLAVLAWSAWGH